jgi:hypothetical protein
MQHLSPARLRKPLLRTGARGSPRDRMGRGLGDRGATARSHSRN